MRVFILSTGRCGSTTIYKACQHISNYTTSHESLTKKFGEDRFNYPNQHIESDNRLSWHLGELNSKFGDDAFYIHLKRDKNKVAASFMKRFNDSPQSVSIIDAFCRGIRMKPAINFSEEQKLQACFDYINTIDSNIELFLQNKSKKQTINLEDISIDFPVFWKSIQAKGDLNMALNEFDTLHNASI